MFLTYKYRIKDRSARKTLRRHAYAVNQVWNYCVATQRITEDRYRSGARQCRWLTNYDLNRLTSGTCDELGIPATVVNVVCRKFVNARSQHQKCPGFRVSSGPRRSLGWIPFRGRDRQTFGNTVRFYGKAYRFWEGGRPLPHNAGNGCFVEDARGRWYVCFDLEVSTSEATTRSEIGIDLGLKTLATSSDGAKIPALQHYRQHELKLATAQRAGNMRRVRAIHAKIANARRDQLHKASTKVARENVLIVVGNVNAGRLKQTKMAKSVSDAGWSMFRNMLRYKASRHGARYEEVDERFTSQLCSACGCIGGPKGIAQLGIRRWECDCGAVHDRDVNAAINILNVALSAQRRGDESRSSVREDIRIGTKRKPRVSAAVVQS